MKRKKPKKKKPKPDWINGFWLPLLAGLIILAVEYTLQKVAI